jgi:predicted dinucleotide-binding enzyme
MRRVEITIIGTGNIGSALARHWDAAGHGLHLGSRDPEDEQVQQLAAEVGADVSQPAVATARGEVVVLAVPGAVVVPAVHELRDQLAGRTLLIPANEMGASTGNMAAAVAEAAPGCEVIRAFNTIPFELIASGQIEGEPVDGFYVSTEDASAVAEQLISECGLRPIRVGGLEQGALLDALFALWVELAFRRGWGRGIAFGLRGG